MTFPRLLATACLAVCLITQTQGADKYTNENRPYEFGFNIDGEQHRHEKKDEKGLIMGEFGFITADGVYHVTVYATDEQGRFKILSMKNIRTKPYPNYKQSNSSARQGHSLDISAPEQTITPQVTNTQKPLKKISIEPPARSCSHCSIPTTSSAPPLAPQNIPDYPNIIKTSDINNDQRYPGQPAVQPNYPTHNSPQFQSIPQQLPGSAPQFPGNSPSFQGNVPQFPQVPNINYPERELSLPKAPQDGSQQRGPASAARTPKRLDDTSSFVPQTNAYTPEANELPKKPVLINAQMQIVDKNTDIYKLGPGEKPGLPKGLTKDNMSTLLYTFNYTVGFHGHHEEGYTNGVKQGYYYVTGRNDVRTRVDYIADSNGFRPKITQEVLDLLSDDVPKPETEKEERFGLKGYEFKWLYFPVESKGK